MSTHHMDQLQLLALVPSLIVTVIILWHGLPQNAESQTDDDDN